MVDICPTEVKEMVCLSDEGTIQCTVRDMIGTCSKKSATLQLYPDKTVSSVFTEISTEFSCDINSVELALQNNGSTDLIILNSYKDKTLREAGVRFDSSSRTLIIITQLKTKNMTLYVQGNNYDDDLLLGASASPTAAEGPANTMDPPPALMSVDFYNSSRAHSSRDNRATYEPCNYVGLVNQAMTCYLNSLLQALYMTPEFRNALYNWEFDGSNPGNSIPFQLQRLFLNLQTSPKSAVETTDLTHSFGWNMQQAWEQHDIQELCRVMFDALEQKFKDTKQAHLINDLYEGKMLDYVKCLECSTEKSREDTFQDIPLPVRPFCSSVAYNSVEEALRAFVQPETLEDNNQYFCEKCNKKCDAHKGLKFIKFPYLLTLHLKRFDFDYNTMNRIKLNDKVVFPEKLNLNSFIVDTNNVLPVEEVLEERETLVKCDDCSTTDSGSALDDESCQGTDIMSTANGTEDNCPDDDEGIDVSSGNHHENEKNRLQEPTGPYKYELFSIMIHSGSASGGHYYAYIKDFSKNLWFCFNDQSVTRVTEDDIQKTYGGGSQRGYYSGAYTSSTNAYMLMYRQIDSNRNCEALSTEEFPEHIKQLLHDMREKEESDRLMKEKENNTYKIKICCHVPGQDHVSEERFFVFSDTPLTEATIDAYLKFKLKDIVQFEDCRLVAYSKSMDAIEYSFEDTEAYFCDITKKCTEFLLEIKKPGDVFEEYAAGGVMMKVYHVVNLKESQVEGPSPMWITHSYTYEELRTRMALLFKLNTVHIVQETNNNPPQYLEGSKEKVMFDSRCKNIKLYVSEATDIEEDDEGAGIVKPFAMTKLAAVIEEFVHRITFDVILPDSDSATLEKLSIPSLHEYPLREREREFERDQSNSEDSSLSDSDRTLVGDAPGDNLGILSSSSNSPVEQQHMTSTDQFDEASAYKAPQPQQMNWEDEEYDDVEINEEENKLYRLNVVRMNSPDTKFCRVHTDKRNTIGNIKKALSSVLFVHHEYYKIYRQYPNQDVEWTSLTDTLGSIKNGDRLIVKLGRVLKKNEVSAKVHLLQLNNPEPIKFWFEWIIAKDQTVGSAKKEILLQAKKQCMIDIPFNSCRLRKKSLKNPGRIFLDEEKFFEDTIVSTNLELLVQVINTTEKRESELVLFVRRWHPETLTLSKFEEIAIEVRTVDEVKKSVSELSDIPLEHVEVTCVKCSFPCDMNILEIHSKLDWNPDVQALENYPLQIYDDGSTFYYRDNREALKELTIEERKELNQSENKRLGRFSMKTNSPRRERGLKIYVDTSPKKEDDVLLD